MKGSKESELKDRLTATLESSRHKHSSRRSKQDESASHKNQCHLKCRSEGHTRVQDRQINVTEFLLVMKISVYLTVIRDQKVTTKSQLHTERKSLLLDQENKVGQGHMKKFIFQG